MDALEFLRERKRMCESYEDCCGCSIENKPCIISRVTSDESCKRIVDVVEKWSKEHPRKTRQSMFLEMFPNASIISNGILGICPKSLDKDRECFYSANFCNNRHVDCIDCRKKFWLEEVDE